jgi:ABC-type antimicrobial peptide transport system permease subunit
MVKYHLSFDSFHTTDGKENRIYRIFTEFHEDKIRYNTGVPNPLGEAFKNDFTVAEKVGRVAYLSKKLISTSPDKKFEEDVAFADPELFDILNFPLVRGSKQSVLKERNTAIITENIARKYFGTADPVGQTIHLDDTLSFTITGILKDLPANTDFRQEIYFPFDNIKDHSPYLVEKDWWYSVNKGMQCFVVLKQGISSATIDNKVLSAISDKHYDKRLAQEFRFKTQPVTDIHFNPNLNGYIEKKNLWALSFIGFLLIITTCINFINLTIAQALGRSKEIGVRKVLGSQRWQLFLQFIIETALIAIIAMTLSFLFSQLALPYLNRLFDTQLRMNIFKDLYLLSFLAALLIIVIFLSGAYPGLVISGFQPIQALKNKLSQKHIGGFSLRKGLVITQFAISQLLIINTLVIANQIRYSRQADLGFHKDAIIMLPVPINEKSSLSTLSSLFTQIAGVEKFTFCQDAPAGKITPNTSIVFDNRTESEKFSIYFKAGDNQYIPTFGLKILEGRNLQPSDTIREYLINETAVKSLGLSSNLEVIGKSAIINGTKAPIVGVVKDFHNKSFHEAIDPVYLSTSDHHYISCAVKINISNLRPVMEKLEKSWKEVYPNYIYKYNFLDAQIEQFYKVDNMIFKLIQIFTVISIIVGCFGLYSLVSFMAAQRTKEVGIRKALGASVENIIWLFGKEFIYMLLIAFVIAAPLGWVVMNNWLETFVYRIHPGAGVFILAIVISLGIAILTVGYRSLKAAKVNPVKSLRSE